MVRILIAVCTLMIVSFPAFAAATPDTVFLEELTWTEVRDAIKAGKTTVIFPTGGTEQNDPHMVLGRDRHSRRDIRYLPAHGPQSELDPEGQARAGGRPQSDGCFGQSDTRECRLWKERPRIQGRGRRRANQDADGGEGEVAARYGSPPAFTASIPY